MATDEGPSTMSSGELFDAGFQDGHYHAENATGQTTSEERRTSEYRDGYLAGRTDRRAYLNSVGRRK